jgi:CMP-N-acetylneuraminic acid synthetase
VVSHAKQPTHRVAQRSPAVKQTRQLPQSSRRSFGEPARSSVAWEGGGVFTSGGEVIAIIPARGGSKGVAHKNLRAVGGVPLVERAIAAARACPAINRVVVTTDDSRIAAAASRCGAEVVLRPRELASDDATSEAALLHALEVIQARDVVVDVVVFIQCTSPFIDPQRLSEAVARVQFPSAGGAEDVVFAAVPSHGFLWRTGATGIEGINHDTSVRLRRQDRAPEYLETGAFYAMRAAGFVESGHRFFGRVGIVVVEESHAIEIDTEAHLTVANALAPFADIDIHTGSGARR